MAADGGKHVVVDRRSSPSPKEQDYVDRLTWVGPALVPNGPNVSIGPQQQAAPAT